MFESDKIKGIIFDYGGTIDSNGMHWAEVIWMAYQAEEVPVSKEIFRNAYVHGERTLGKNPIVKPHHTFLDMLRLKTDIQIEWLKAGDFIPEAYATPGLKQRLAMLLHGSRSTQFVPYWRHCLKNTRWYWSPISMGTSNPY